MPVILSTHGASPAPLILRHWRPASSVHRSKPQPAQAAAGASPTAAEIASRRGYLQKLKASVAATSQPTPVEKLLKATEGPIILNGQVLHSIAKERLELVNSMADYVTERVLPVLKPVERCWQPIDFLPASESDSFLDEVQELRLRAATLPDDYLVVLVGDMVTEEALPTYMAMLNTLDGVRDETGAAPTPWARWTREWTAEENRHGDLMNKYCYLSGRVNMRVRPALKALNEAVEKTIQHLIGSGMDPKTENNPYLCFIYTSFQERATKVSHGATARHALAHGNLELAHICGAIAADEGRHEVAYTRIVDELWRLDPSGTMLAFSDMMKKTIQMPAHLMNDGEHAGGGGRSLFADFSAVAESTGTYTAADYLAILEHLIQRWAVGSRSGLTVEAQHAQDVVMQLPTRFRAIGERREARKASKSRQPVEFSWLFNREVPV